MDENQEKKRKREKEEEEIEDFEEEDFEEKEKMNINQLIKKKKVKKDIGNEKFGLEFKARKGTGGDMKRKGKQDPFAYIPLNPKALSKRTKDSTFKKFGDLTKKTKRKK